jgi:hypothetical protein
MDTVTIYKDMYDNIVDSEFKKGHELAYVRGTIAALAGMKDNPQFVFEQLEKMKAKIDLGVDISA